MSNQPGGADMANGWAKRPGHQGAFIKPIINVKTASRQIAHIFIIITFVGF